MPNDANTTSKFISQTFFFSVLPPKALLPHQKWLGDLSYAISIILSYIVGYTIFYVKGGERGLQYCLLELIYKVGFQISKTGSIRVYKLFTTTPNSVYTLLQSLHYLFFKMYDKKMEEKSDS